MDFVANKGSDKYYIQSAYSIEGNNKRQQELQSLLNTGDNLKMVIVYDNFIKWQDDNGIIYRFYNKCWGVTRSNIYYRTN